MSLFPAAEFEARVARAQALMDVANLDALLLTTEPEVRYVTGYLTRFWESPTRPWFVIVPATGQPIAVIPSIGAPLMGQTWLTDIRTWRSPDYNDDGISLLADALGEAVPKGGRIGVPSGPETHLRLPLDSWAALQAALPDRSFGDDDGTMRRLRLIKSEAEVEKIAAACAIADAAFARVPDIARVGAPLSNVFRAFQGLCLEEGADWVSYLAGGAGPGGYGDIIAPATDTPLATGDVLMLDTGVVRDGYFSDFDRNWSLGPAAPETASAYARLIEASDAAFAAARPGATAADLFHAMDKVLTGGAGGSDAGRYGHGLGMQLTEWPSLIPDDHTVLEPSMVLTLEPGLELGAGRTLVHEENIVITPTGARYLSTPAPRSLPEI
ncbi:Xaa-Pro peptidase family protein [uncultured Tateyamaria sp.]|uniref:M24 family metallopeptidase n=1 Tax=uncultured Tateyamaria sp. TaxID=455651 RepID=UPI00261AB7D8|nr:Xaa-Pro peptidase family protein [uncultured Tateyamaria sp.]